MGTLAQDDPQVFRIVRKESVRVENTLDLIAAENHPPLSILEAQGSILGMKAAEGYPGRRFHAGCRHADEVERLAVARARTLFGAEHVNVQPHSGVSANLAVYFSVLTPGDRVLSMRLDHGGHLSHGDSASITSRCFEFRHYGVDARSERIDYREVRRIAAEFRPRMIVAGASSYPRRIDYEAFAEIARKHAAYLLVDMAHIAGLVAGRAIPSPVPVSDFVTFTTYKTLQGGRGGVILCRKKHAPRIEKTLFPGAQGTPSLNLVAAKAVCFKRAAEPSFRSYQRKIVANAKLLAAALQKRGYRIVSGGTDIHLVLVDLGSKGLTGKAAETALESVGIIVNRNPIPNDPRPPEVAGGIRIGSAAITARGIPRPEMEKIVEWIDKALAYPDRKPVLSAIAAEVAEFCAAFPVYRRLDPHALPKPENAGHPAGDGRS
jgi:glycine hydroxymethyltransferase